MTNKVFHSRTYFRDLAKQAEQDRGKIRESLIAEDEQGFIEDMADQILSLAKVCNEKHEFLFIAEKFMAASFIIGLVIYVFGQFFCVS